MARPLKETIAHARSGAFAEPLEDVELSLDELANVLGVGVSNDSLKVSFEKLQKDGKVNFSRLVDFAFSSDMCTAQRESFKMACSRAFSQSAQKGVTAPPSAEDNSAGPAGSAGYGPSGSSMQPKPPTTSPPAGGLRRPAPAEEVRATVVSPTTEASIMDAVRQRATELKKQADKYKESLERPLAEVQRQAEDLYDEHQWDMVQWVNSKETAPKIAEAIADVLCTGLGSKKADPYIVQAFGSEGNAGLLLQLLRGAGSDRGELLLSKLAAVLWEAMQELEKSAATTAQELNLKFASESSATLAFGKLATFYEGLDSLVGLPSAKPMEAMCAEHCHEADSIVEWTTANYGVKTTPRIEWHFVTKPTDESKRLLQIGEWPQETINCKDHRRSPMSLEELNQKVEEEVQAEFRGLGEPEMLDVEVIGARLYTGPMFEKYNAVARGGALRVEQISFMRNTFNELCKGNHYTTTVHVINSALIKLAKLTKLQEASKVFRGVTGRRLPKEFWTEDEIGFRGGVEFGFLSATRDRGVAAGYASMGGNVSVLLEFHLTAVDRGADLEVLSQYPHEKEICFPPLTNLGVTGSRVEGSLLVVEIGINVNHGAMTIDKLLEKNKELVKQMCKNLHTQVDQDLFQAGIELDDIKLLAHKSLDEIVDRPRQAFNEDSKFRTLINRALDVKRMVRRALNLKSMEERFGRTHMTTLASYHSLGVLLQTMGHYEKSMTYLRQSLMRFEHVLKPTEPMVLKAQIDLGRLLDDMAKYGEAEPLLRKALYGFQKAFGERHPATLQALNDFGVVQLKSGKYNMARLIFEKALSAGEKIFGPIHPETLNAAHNLGNTEFMMGRSEAAVDLHRRAQEGRDATLGPMHQDTLESVHKLGLSLAEAGRPAESLDFLVRALTGREDTMGDDHVDTLESLDGMGKVYRKLDSLDQSKDCLERALRGREKVLNPFHHKTLKTVASLATVLQKTKDSKGAEEMFRRAFDGLRETLGDKHPDTLKAGTNLAGHLAECEKTEEGEELLRWVVDSNKDVHAPHHTDALYAIEKLAGVYVMQSKKGDVEKMLQEVYKLRCSSESPVHPNTSKTLMALASFYYQEERYSDAEGCNSLALAGFESMSGVDDSKTIRAAKSLCDSMRKNSRVEEAERLEQRRKVVVDDVLLGTLNCLGEGYNPVEFMTSDTAFCKCYNELENVATGMTWLKMEQSCVDVISKLQSPHLVEVVGKMREHCKDNVVGEVWSFFSEEVLKSDNKLLENRLNMINFGMQKSPDGTQLQWQLNGSNWGDEMVKLAEDAGSGKTYKKDPNLFLWDLACNVVTASCVDQYRQICEASHLNPANFTKMANNFITSFLKANESDVKANGTEIKCRPALLALQEWPRESTEKGEKFRQVLNEKNFKIVDAPGVALAYTDPDKFLGDPTIAIGGEVDEQFVEDLLERTMPKSKAGVEYEQAKEKIFKDLRKIMATTRKKILAVHFAKVKLAVIVVHAKEPNTPTATAVLVEFISQIGMKLVKELGEDTKWVAMADTNVATQKNAGVFVEELFERGLMQVPMLSASTTAKRRSLLHGQCYDVNKSLKLVTAPKDKIISTPGSLREATISPDLSGSKVLPSETWASDHSLVTAVLDLYLLKQCRHEQRQCHRDTSQRNLVPEQSDVVVKCIVEEFNHASSRSDSGNRARLADAFDRCNILGDDNIISFAAIQQVFKETGVDGEETKGVLVKLEKDVHVSFDKLVKHMNVEGSP